MVRRKILCFAVVFVVLAMLATPVLAIGPLKALEVGKNPKLVGNVAMGNVMLDDAGGNTFTWVSSLGLFVDNCDANFGAGRMNNAIVADIALVLAMRADPTLNENKWVYLSGLTGGETWDSPSDVPDAGVHGMFYWTIRPAFGAAASAVIEAEHPYGVFAKRNVVGK